MRRKISMLLVLVLTFSFLSACGQNSGTVTSSVDTSEAEANAVKPELSEIRAICNLATLECYYHNVAKSTKESGTGLAHAFEKQRTFWIEYTGTAKIGIDMSAIKMEMNGTDITITIPPAKLLSYEVKEISTDDYISTEDGKINKNPISADDQTGAVDQAQEAMKESVESNSTLLATAQERAKKLIANYIEQLGDASEVEYNIHWEYEENTSASSVQ